MKRLVVLLLLLAACQGETADTTTTTVAGSTSPPAGDTADSTTPPDTTASTASTASTGAPTRYEVGETGLFPPEPLPGSGGASGSGCSPGEGGLPGGIWFGTVHATAPTSIDFDLACFFFGDAANVAAAEDGETEIPVPNDYYIRNDNPALRTLVVDAAAVVHRIPSEPSAGLEPIGWSEWPAERSGYVPCPGESCLVWLYVNDGLVTEVVQKYTP